MSVDDKYYMCSTGRTDSLCSHKKHLGSSGMRNASVWGYLSLVQLVEIAIDLTLSEASEIERRKNGGRTI